MPILAMLGEIDTQMLGPYSPHTGADPVMRLQANGVTPGLIVESMEPTSDPEGMVDASMVNGFVTGVFLNQTFHDVAFASAGGNNFVSVFNLPSDAVSGPSAVFFPPPGLNDFPLSYPIGGGRTALRGQSARIAALVHREYHRDGGRNAVRQDVVVPHAVR